VYSLTISAPNFKQSTLARLEIHASDRLRRDFTLEIGARTEVVTVQVEGSRVQLESAEIRDVLGRQQVVDLPVKERQFLDLAMLSPGVVRPPGGTRGDAMQQAGNLVNVLYRVPAKRPNVSGDPNGTFSTVALSACTVRD
jgi:hypothetical protein